MKQRADWLAWSLQFIAGVVAGFIVGFIAISRQGNFWMRADHAWTLLLGAALFGAGLASHYGDELWGAPLTGLFRPRTSSRARQAALFPLAPA
jgi:hypothetical protein